MEEFLEVAATLLVVFILVGVPVLAIRSWIRDRRLRRDVENHGNRLSTLSTQIQELREQVKQLRGLEAKFESLRGEVESLRRAPPSTEPPQPPPPITKPIVALKPEVVIAPPALPVAPVPVLPSQPAEVGGRTPLQLTGASPAPPKREVALPVPTFASLSGASAASGFEARVKAAGGLEELLGTNWLNKLGIIILVIGVALFLAYQMRQMGPMGKVTVGFITGGALLAAGVFYERRDRYRILARAGIGGGWALLFFTTYAMHHVRAARVIESQILDLVLMLIVAAAMGVHTLRYHSQVVTALAFLLAFSTITLSHENVYSLSAGAVLALALVVVVYRRRWFELEIFGILATFFNHFYWVRPIIERVGRHHVFPELNASIALLILYWLVFRVSYLVRRSDDKHEENISTLAALLNTFMFYGLVAYQAARPELAFWFLLGTGATEMVLGQLPVARRSRSVFAILSTIGAVLLVAAFAYRYSGSRLSVIWLLEAEGLLLAGIFTRESLFRRLGLLASLVVAGHMMFVDLVDLVHRRNALAGDFSEPRMALVFALGAAVLYANCYWVSKRWPEVAETEYEALGLKVVSYIAASLCLLAVWALSNEPWLAVGFGALTMGLAIWSARANSRDLYRQALAVGTLALVRALAVNLQEDFTFHGLTFRVLTVPVVIAFFYLTSGWLGRGDWATTRRIPASYTWVASGLLGTLLWYELRPISVAPAWALFGLVLFELGFARRYPALRLQAYTAFLAAFFRVFFVNLNADDIAGELSPRVYTILPLAAVFFYAYWRLDASRDDALDLDRRLNASDLNCYLGTLTIAAVMRFEMDRDWVITAWAALVVVTLAIAWRTLKRIFLYQGLVLGLMTLCRAVLHNFYERSYFPPPFWQSRWLTVGLTIALLFAALGLAFRLRPAASEKKAQKASFLSRALSFLDRRPEQVFFFLPVLLLTVLLAIEVRKGMTTVAWGAEAVAVFLFALWVGQRSYRLTGLALLLLCVGKIVIVDVWGLESRDRYLTFIALGAALLLVSFLYTRYRETIRQYL